VFRHTADYDSAIDEYLSATLAKSPSLRLLLRGRKTLRYGENDHQKASFFPERRSVVRKEPNLGSANSCMQKNSASTLVDADAALESSGSCRNPRRFHHQAHESLRLRPPSHLGEAFEAPGTGTRSRHSDP